MRTCDKVALCQMKATIYCMSNNQTLFKVSNSMYVNLQVVNYNKRNKSPSNWASKSNLSTGYRYYDGKMVNTSPIPHSSLSPENSKHYLFEALIGKFFIPSFYYSVKSVFLGSKTDLQNYRGDMVRIMHICIVVILQEKIEAVCGIKCSSGKMCFWMQ